MATLATVQRNANADAVKTALTGGNLIVRNSSNATLFTIAFGSFSSPSGGTITCTLTSTTASGAGTADNYLCTSSGATTIISGPVSELGLSSTTVYVGSPVSGTFSYTEQASTC